MLIKKPACNVIFCLFICFPQNKTAAVLMPFTAFLINSRTTFQSAYEVKTAAVLFCGKQMNRPNVNSNISTRQPWRFALLSYMRRNIVYYTWFMTWLSCPASQVAGKHAPAVPYHLRISKKYTANLCTHIAHFKFRFDVCSHRDYTTTRIPAVRDFTVQAFFYDR